MKLKLYLMMLALCGVMVFQSCDDDDDKFTPSVELKSALSNKYPDATHVEWEKKAGYYVADFYDNGKDTEVWFSTSAQWLMTKTEYGKNISLLPQAVQTAFGNSDYANWTVDDADKYERTDRTFYVVEIEKKGQKDRCLYYEEDGSLIKDVEDNGNHDIRPNTQI